jgi:DNA-binding beta-propeller fold protein YncE
MRIENTFSLLIRRILLIIPFLFNSCVFGQKQIDIPLILKGEIPLPGVKGRIDHLAFNQKQNVVYVAALGNNTVEVVDLKSKKVIHTLKGLHEPQGIGFVPETNAIVVANGENGNLDVYDATTYRRVNSIKLGADADNVRYDVNAKTIYVGFESGAIISIDALTLKQNWIVKLPGHPESFQLSNNKQIFVNIPSDHSIAVIDLIQKKMIRNWEISEASSNFPMAIDSTNKRLFIGCRNPAKLLIFDSRSGKSITMLNMDEDTDDLFYDKSSGTIYASCGKGYVDIFRQSGPDNYQMLIKIETASGARTSLFIPEISQLIVAAPSRERKDARLLVYGKNKH